MQKSVKKAVFQSIGTAIRTRRESQCLPNAEFFLLAIISIPGIQPTATPWSHEVGINQVMFLKRRKSFGYFRHFLF